MRRVSFVVVCVVCVVCVGFVALAPWASAGPDTLEIDVSDLALERPGPAIYPVGWRVLHSNATIPARLIVGEANLLCGLEDPKSRPELPGHPGPYDLPAVPAIVENEALVAAVAAASKIAANACSIEEGRLRVRSEDAPAVRAALAAIRQAGPPSVQLDVQLETGDAPGTSEILFSASGPMRAGVPHVLADAVTTNVLTDYEVEIAQACVIANPVPQARRTGASLLTRVHPVPGTNHAIVEAVLRVAEPLADEPIDLGHPGFGPIDRCLTGFEDAAVTVVTENGKPTRQLWTGRQGRPLRFTLTASWAATTSEDRLLWSRLLEGPIAGFRNWGREALPGWGDDERGLSTPVRSDLQRLLGGAGARPDTGATPLEVDVLLVPAGAPVVPGKPAPDGAREVARARVLVTEGLPACFNGSREQLYLVDWDVEVAQAARVPDPIVGQVQEGHFLEATVVRRGAGGLVRLDLELLRLARLDRIVVPLDVAQSGAGVQGDIRATAGPAGSRGSAGSIYTAPSMPQNTVALEQPALHSLRITSDIPLASNGTGMLRRSARGFTGEAQDVVVIVRIPAP